MRGFSKFHPAVSGMFFLSVIGITMFSQSPFLLLLSFLGSILFLWKNSEARDFFKSMGFYIALFFITALSNPLFSHNGITILFFFNNNPITLESILYGVHLGFMLLSVFFWFKAFNIIMTEEKLLFLFGGLSPKIALILTTSLRFIPLLQRQSRKIREAQTALGLFSNDTWILKIKSNLRVFYALISWAFENAVDVGSSMKGRGYGLKGKTRYSLFKFRKNDLGALIFILTFDAFVIASMVFGHLDFSFYPALTEFDLNLYSSLGIISFGLVSFFPVTVEIKDSIMWRYYKSVKL